MEKYIDADKLLSEKDGMIDTVEVKEPISIPLTDFFDAECPPLNQEVERMVYDAFNAGTEWQKQQMLKEAVEGYVTFNCDMEEEGLPCVTVIANEKPLEFYESRGFKLGDKVKIVIVSEKEDSK